MLVSLPRAMPSLCTSISVACAVYLLIARFTRWRVYNRLHRKYAHLDPARNPDARRMTATEAQDITHASIVWDMRAVLANALSFAIVRTYAIVRVFFVERRARADCGFAGAAVYFGGAVLE